MFQWIISFFLIQGFERLIDVFTKVETQGLYFKVKIHCVLFWNSTFLTLFDSCQTDPSESAATEAAETRSVSKNKLCCSLGERRILLLLGRCRNVAALRLVCTCNFCVLMQWCRRSAEASGMKRVWVSNWPKLTWVLNTFTARLIVTLKAYERVRYLHEVTASCHWT